MEKEYLSRVEHEEYRRSADAHHAMLAKRIDSLQDDLSEIRLELAETRQIASDIRAIQINIEHMMEEQKNQGERLKGLEDRSLNVRLEHAEHEEADLEKRVAALEQKPGRHWDKFVTAIISALGAAIATLILTGTIG